MAKRVSILKLNTYMRSIAINTQEVVKVIADHNEKDAFSEIRESIIMQHQEE